LGGVRFKNEREDGERGGGGEGGGMWCLASESN